ncbi:MAG: hypothetical protein RLZZ203_2037, partial [Cyanobacteriota bacterium]
YGAIAYKCIYPPKGTKLAIIISPPHVRFCPSSDGLDGVFIRKMPKTLEDVTDSGSHICALDKG